MKTFRTATLIAVCLGLALPGAHALALCIGCDGSLALDVAVDGACTGTKTQGHSTARTPAEGLGCTTDAVDGCGGCTDVVLSGGGAAIPPTAVSGKVRPSRTTDETTNPADALGDSHPRACSGASSSSYAPVSGRPPQCRSVVLRL
jgi:hypothetical protein